jgi:glycosyltransferase involved in cell wall biosynthesis
VNTCTDAIRVCFLFRVRNTGSMGGAETSMLRMLRRADPSKLDASALFFGADNASFRMQFENIGIKVTVVHGFRDLFSVLRMNRPEVLYMFARLHAILWSIVAVWSGVSARVVAERGCGTDIRDRLSHFFGRILENGFLANSIAAKAEIMKSGVREKNIWVVYNGIDDEEKEEPSESGVAIVGKPQVVCVANIKPMKDIRTLLLAVNDLRYVFPNLKAILVGADFTEGEFFRQTQRDGLDDTFVWLGPMSNPFPIIDQADAFVLPSKKEGMPTSILEAMSRSKAVIASAVNGIPELIHHGVTGFLFQAGDWRGLSALLNDIFSNPTMAGQLGKNAREWVLKNRSVDQMLAGHYKVFTECREKNLSR